MDDSVVSVCVSPDGNYVAVALLGDNKVKVNTIFQSTSRTCIFFTLH